MENLGPVIAPEHIEGLEIAEYVQMLFRPSVKDWAVNAVAEPVMFIADIKPNGVTLLSIEQASRLYCTSPVVLAREWWRALGELIQVPINREIICYRIAEIERAERKRHEDSPGPPEFYTCPNGDVGFAM